MARSPYPIPISQPLDSIVDDLYLSYLFLQEDMIPISDQYAALVHDDTIPISDDEYAEALQFQETLMASLITSQITTKSLSSSPILCFSSSSMPSSSKAVEIAISPKAEQIGLVIEEDDEPSSPLIICEICVEAKESDEMFRNQRCDHSFCSECVIKHVATKIRDSITVVSCPGLNCKGVLEVDACRAMLPKELLDRWSDALCEAHLLAANKFYCPFRDCSAMLLVDGEGGENVRESECPYCHRLFCAECNVPWHAGVGCEEFKTLNEDERGREDLIVRELVNQKKWSRCPQCKFYVEKREGCLHITCRCQYQFCYACGEQWTSAHWKCQRN